MDPAARGALEHDLTVDITTTGRTTGAPRRLEIWLTHADGRFFITGTPGRRAWLANLKADPHLIVHLKQAVIADVAAVAVVVEDEPTRRWLFSHEAAWWYLSQVPLETLVAAAPMVELHFTGAG